MGRYRYAVSVMPKAGILDPQGRAVETSLPHLHVDNVRDVRVGRRVELTVEAASEAEARPLVERLAGELFANPLIEAWTVEASGEVPAQAGADAPRASGALGVT
jgi:phosphoribosylformylglycinamidine synthase subunit PurS